jgi:sugar phosphate isomerase/epimerase
LKKTVRFLGAYPFKQVEFYSPPGHDRQIAKLFAEAGFSSVLIGVIALKGAGVSLCARDAEERSRAVTILKNCMDRALEIGSHGVMLNSGFIPGYSLAQAIVSTPAPEQLKAACDAYVHSIEEASEYGERRGYNITLLLEPGDSNVQSFQLLGSTDRVLETTKRIRKQCRYYALTMDVAHLREEGEDVMSSLRQTLPYCDHIHLCNCVMDDPAEELYGDKHVDFDYPGACWNYEDFRNMYRNIRDLYTDRDFTITLEITCRAADNEAWFDGVVSRCSWIFEDE